MASALECQYVILHYFASILILVGILTPVWASNWEDGSLNIQRGLMKNCFHRKCIENSSNQEIKYSVLAGFFLSIVCDIVVTVHCILKSLSIADIIMLLKIAFCSALIGAILIFIGCLVYAINNFGNDLYPGYSYGFAISGGFALLAAGIASSRTS